MRWNQNKTSLPSQYSLGEKLKKDCTQNNEEYGEEEWNRMNYEFWEQHQFYTSAGKFLFGKAKKRHIKKLKGKMKKKGEGQ